MNYRKLRQSLPYLKLITFDVRCVEFSLLKIPSHLSKLLFIYLQIKNIIYKTKLKKDGADQPLPHCVAGIVLAIILRFRMRIR